MFVDQPVEGAYRPRFSRIHPVKLQVQPYNNPTTLLDMGVYFRKPMWGVGSDCGELRVL